MRDLGFDGGPTRPRPSDAEAPAPGRGSGRVCQYSPPAHPVAEFAAAGALDGLAGAAAGDPPLNSEEGRRTIGRPLVVRPVRHGPWMNVRSLANSLACRSVIRSYTPPPTRLTKNQSWPAPPVSTSCTPSSNTVVVLSLTAPPAPTPADIRS